MCKVKHSVRYLQYYAKTTYRIKLAGRWNPLVYTMLKSLSEISSTIKQNSPFTVEGQFCGTKLVQRLIG